jgi:sugar phosphate isomerase/epimerase
MRYILPSLILILLATGIIAHAQQKPSIGICASLENDALLVKAGYPFIVESVQKLFSPQTVSDEQFEQKLEIIKNLSSQLFAVNIFIPGDLKLLGPKVDSTAILTYAEKVFSRCKSAGVQMIVLGSSGARKIPDGFERQTATDQFVHISKQLASLASKYQITIALENLNRGETNFINSVSEALNIVKQVSHPNFRLCADIYHMLKEGEGPAILLQTKEYLIHCDVAEKEKRTPPGVKGQDFKPYFRALRAIGYSGKIVIEANWESLEKQAAPARKCLELQINESYSE